ncbi:MAG: sigma-70 family RNA polymerase sigma factor [Planctomycetes bacterium]|nr:sigma-70 family RNA polymerase sigma factor [Planctomycetota bacterium]
MHEQVSRILDRVDRDGTDALSELMPYVYEQLRALAGKYMGVAHAGHTLQPTALVHEAFARLASGRDRSWESRGHVLAVCARAMRDILVDRARRRGAAKRGGDRQQVTLNGLMTEDAPDGVDLLALDEALSGLRELDPRQAEIVELRFFGGMTGDEIAGALSISRPTVVRELRTAQLWLRRALAN